MKTGKVSFKQRADRVSLSLADELISKLTGIKAVESNPRNSSTVPNYFVYLDESEEIIIFNLCLWDGGCVGLQFRHIDFLSPAVVADAEVKLYQSMSWPEYKFRDNGRQLAKALRLCTDYITMIRPAVIDGTISPSGSGKAERHLRKRLKILYPNETIKYNYRSYPWLSNLELDIVLQGMQVAIEVQGGQHFSPVWGAESFKRIQANDERKARACRNNKVSLIRLNERQCSQLTDDELKNLIERAYATPGLLLDCY